MATDQKAVEIDGDNERSGGVMRIQKIAIALGMVLAGCTVSQPRIQPSISASVSAAPVPIVTPAAVSLVNVYIEIQAKRRQAAMSI